MKTFYVFVIIFLIVMIVLILSFGFAIRDYLVIIKNLLFDIKAIGYTTRDYCDDLRVYTTTIRNHCSEMHGLLIEEPKKDEPDENSADTGDVWALAPCPECGGPASMHYDHDSGDGYFVMCSKYSRCESCRYSIIAGGSTRRLAATEWNRNVVNYARKKVQMELNND